jgi:hypothetical protein
MGTIARRRLRLAAAAVGILVAGLLTYWFGDGALASFAGDVLYAALVYTLIGVVWARARPIVIASAALGFCAAIELLQLTPLSGDLSRSIPGAYLVFGSTFQWIDLAAYALGVALIAIPDARAATRSAASSARTAIDSAPVQRADRRVG